MILNFIFVTTLRVTGAIASLLLTIVIARSLLLDEAGNAFLFLSTVNLAKIFCLGGMHIVGLKLISNQHSMQNWSEIDEIARKTMSVTVAISLATSAVIYLNSDAIAKHLWSNPSMSLILKIAALTITPAALVLLYSHYLQAIQKTYLSMIAMTVSIPLATLSAIYIVNISTAQGVALAAISATAISLFLVVLLWMKQPRPSPTKTTQTWRSILSTAPDFWLIGVLAAVTQHGAQLTSARWLETEAISTLAVATQMKAIISIVLVAMNFILAPKISAMFHAGKQLELKRLVWKYQTLTLSLAIPVLIILWLFAENILAILFGPQYERGGDILRILLIGQAINVVVGPVGYLLQLTNNQNILRNISIASTFLTIILTIFMTSKYGVTGAATALTVGIALHNIATMLFVRRQLKINTLLFWKFQSKQT